MSNVRQTKKGPKTTLGINPDGETVWLTIQAPTGYIKINENLYWEILKIELSKVKFKSKTAKGITEELEEAATRAMKSICKLIAATAPRDRGDLADSFEVVKPGSVLLEDDDSKRTLLLGMEE